MTAIVFIAASAGSLPRIVDAAAPQAPAVTLIVADGDGDRTVDSVTVIDVGAIPRGSLLAALERSVVGRTLVRLSPWDGGLRLRRRVRASRSARAAIESATVVVAAERDGILTAWSAVRQNPGALGLATLAAGLAELRRAVA